MPTLLTPDVALHYECFGHGEPVTVFGHGVASGIDETRPLASGVTGTRVFVHFRGHGPTTVLRQASGWDYDALAGDLRAVADETGATRAFGVSMGAAALLRLVTGSPDRFARLVFFLPAVLDTPRSDQAFDRLARMAALVDAHDVVGLQLLLVDELPDEVRALPMAESYCEQRARSLVGTGLSHLLRVLPPLVPVTDRRQLARVRVPALVVGQEGDDVHPAWVARELAAALPDAQLEVFDRAEAMWTDRRRLRAIVTDFLAG